MVADRSYRRAHITDKVYKLIQYIAKKREKTSLCSLTCHVPFIRTKVQLFKIALKRKI